MLQKCFTIVKHKVWFNMFFNLSLSLVRWSAASERLMKGSTVECLWLQMEGQCSNHKVDPSSIFLFASWLLRSRVLQPRSLLPFHPLSPLLGAREWPRMSPRSGMDLKVDVVSVLHVLRSQSNKIILQSKINSTPFDWTSRRPSGIGEWIKSLQLPNANITRNAKRHFKKKEKEVKQEE